MASQLKIILIIEDESPLLDVLKDNITSAGFHVLTAKDGEEGLALALREKPDLILLDIVMPKMDGITMMRELRKDEWGKTAKIILLTNLVADDNIMKDVIATEPAYYLVKNNYTIEDVINKIKLVLGVK